jgi:hypothetical protein
MFARMYNPGGFRRCAICGPLGGLGAIPEASRTSYSGMSSILRARANAARTASASRWRGAESSLVEAIRAGASLQSDDYFADSGSWGEWDLFVDTLDRARYTLASQRRERSSSGPTTVVGEETGGPPSPSTGVGARVPGGKGWSDPEGRTPPASGDVKTAGVGGGFMQMLSSPWALAGLLAVGAVAAVWYTTSTEEGR